MMCSPGERSHRKKRVRGNFHPKWPSRGGGGSNELDQAGVYRKAGRNPAEGGASEVTGRNDLEF